MCSTCHNIRNGNNYQYPSIQLPESSSQEPVEEIRTGLSSGVDEKWLRKKKKKIIEFHPNQSGRSSESSERKSQFLTVCRYLSAVEKVPGCGKGKNLQ